MNKTKMLLIENSFKLFREKGCNNVTIDDICKAVDISRRTFYNHFESKNQLLNALASNYQGRVDLADIYSIMLMDNCWEQFWSLFLPSVAHIASFGSEMASSLLTTALNEKTNAFGYDEQRSSMLISLYEKIIRAGQEKEQFKNRQDPRSLAQLCMDEISKGCIYMWCLKNGTTSLVEETRKALIHLLGVDPSLTEKI